MKAGKQYMIQSIVIAAVIILFSVLFFSSPMGAKENLTGFESAAENRYSKLYVNESTAEIAIENKLDGSIRYSNPPDWEEKETEFGGTAKEKLGSQFSLTYYTGVDVERTIDNNTESIAYEQYSIEALDNGVRIEFDFREEWDLDHWVPKIITKEGMENIKEDLEDEDTINLLLDQFDFITLQKFKEGDEHPDLRGVDPETLFGEYKPISPDLEEGENLYYYIVDRIEELRSDIDDVGEIIPDDIPNLLENMKHQGIYIRIEHPMPFHLEDITEQLKKIGYTPEDKIEDHMQTDMEFPERNQVTFHLPIEYRLDGEDLLVVIDSGEIQYPQNILNEFDELIDFPVHSIDILNFFEAADNREEGYIFVPDGAGGLIELNNQKTGISYSRQVFGDDMAISAETYKENYIEQIHLPVFGMIKEDKAFMGIIEEGAPLANIKANVAGRISSYNNIYPEFILRPVKFIEMEGEAPAIMPGGETRTGSYEFQSRPYEGEIKVRYKFLKGDDVDYVDMALEYRNYLMDSEGLDYYSEGSRSATPFVLELIGAIDVNRPVLGIPRNVIEPLTTLRQIETIIEDFTETGIENQNLHLKYKGWLSGGINHVLPDDVNVESELGGKEQFAKLYEYLQNKNISFYPEVNFLYARRNKWLDGFSVRRDASRFLNRTQGFIYNKFNRASLLGSEGDYSYIISPRKQRSLVSNFAASYREHDISGIALGDMGTQVNSDFNHNKELTVDRDQAGNIMEANLNEFNSSFDIMVSGGNALTYPYADVITEIPFSSSGHYLLDQDIPFIQIALSGLIDFAGEPVNLAENYRKNILKSVETGAIPYFKLSYSPSLQVKQTRFDHFYSIDYRDWLGEAEEIYETFSNEHLRYTNRHKIIDHQQITEGLYKTTFQENTSVIVNYNRFPEEYNDMTVPAKDFIVLSEEARR